MSDDKNKVGQPDRSLIAMGEDHEVSYWTGKFGVDQATLQRAVDQVGNSAGAVEEFLQGQRAG
ncbi:DUF3606 domain-containing protein [Caulobacter sp. NIBR2454]|uniref:DUF3606 domain-containing protein n=1 Tax=Caulobacter sp. NIBR2454 TaxID=3015996 RepID=UPI0022B688FA|nr:DUF3606 domain-containing protein [Caulobacter sp. NIBR2454]